ncbi:MAG: diguanylate cyclase [Xanthobacteraceae bacterium]|nr:diguanylate cyclase [Xanthobacteraceae bacterium]
MPQVGSRSVANGAKWALSIRARLLILAAISLLPLVLDRFRDIESDRVERIETITQQALDFAKQGTAAQNEVIVAARAVLQVAASAYGMVAADPAVCASFLTNTKRQAPWFRSLSVANRDGRIICSTNAPSIGRDVSATSHFQQAVITGEFTLGGYYTGPQIGSVVATAVPHLTADDTLDAVLLGPIQLDWFGRIASALARRSGAVVMMFDGTGTVLARYPASDQWVGQSLRDHATLREMLARTEGNFTGNDIDGVRRIFGFAQLPGVHARLAVGFEESTVLAGARRAIWVAFGQLGFIVALMMIAIWFGGERLILEPIRTLTRAAQRYGRGENGARADTTPWAAEFVPLAAALDDMAGQLAAREQELRASNAHLQELANVDALTDLANRRTFDTRLTAEWRTALKYRQSVAILMIDVDHFKLFNDRYGHVRGDRCLKQLSEAIVASTRTNAATAGPELAMPPSYRASEREPDFAARYGGEEFVVLLRGATLGTATEAAERLRRSVEELRLEHDAAPCGFVTISVGVASLVPAEGEDPQRLTESADAALYAAKHLGRNAVACEPETALSRAG